MEDTNALLSKLVQTKSIERVLAPIATQVSQLVIQNEAYEQGEEEAFPSDPSSTAKEVKASVQHLITAAVRLMHESSDEELKQQMPKAAEALEVSGSDLEVAGQRVMMESFSSESRRHFVRIAKDVLERTLKVLLVTDDAEVRKIVRAANWVRSRLQLLTAVNSVKSMVSSFKSFTESMMLLTSLTEKRQNDIANPRQRDRIVSSLLTMRKCVPMLSSALQTYVKFPHNNQAEASKDYVLGQILGSLDDLVLAIENKPLSLDDEDDDDGDDPGFFVALIDTIADLLTREDLSHVSVLDGELDLSIESAVRHTMAVAHLSVEPHRSLLIKNCQRILHQRSCVSDMGKRLRRGLVELPEIDAELREACRLLLDECQDLERHINASLLQLLVDVFKETCEPIDRMVRAAMEPSPRGAPYADATIQLYIEAFHTHSDRMCQVARFAAASSTDAHKVRAIRACVNLLEKLDPEVVPAALVCHKESHNKAALSHLRLLKAEWSSNVRAMVTALDDITDPKMFIHVSEVEMRKDVVTCKESLNSDAAKVASATRALIGRGRRVVHVTTSIVDSCHDPMFRNALRVYVNKLNKAVPAVKSAANKILRDPSQVSFHESLHRRCDQVLQLVEELRDGLDGRGLPGILHPARSRALRGLGSLDLDGSDSESDSPNEDKKPVRQTSPPKCNGIKDSRQASVTATDNHWLDLLNEELKDFGRNFTSAAVSGDKKKVDQLSSDILSRCNHVTEMARNLVFCLDDESKTNTLQSLSSAITLLTPQLIDQSNAVVTSDAYQVEPLHQSVDLWVSKVSHLESYIDGLIGHWKSTADDVVEAVKSLNSRLMKSSVQTLEEHAKQVNLLVAMAMKLVNMGDVFCQDQAQHLREYANELESLTSLLASLADLSFRATHTSHESNQLQMTCREWATKVCSILSLISKLGQKVIGQQLRASWRSHKVDLTKEKVDFLLIDKQIGIFTENTIRLKDSVTYILHSTKKDKAIQDISLTLDNMDTLLTAMSTCLKDMMDSSKDLADYPELRYTPVKMCLLQWDWARQAKEIEDQLDDITEDYGRLPLVLLINEGSSGTKQEMTESLEGFQRTFRRYQRRITEVLEVLQDSEEKRHILRLLKEMENLHKDVVRAAVKISEGRTEQSTWAWQKAERKWAARCHRLAFLFAKVIGAKSDIFKEVDGLLRGGFSSKESTPVSEKEDSPRKTSPLRQMSPSKSILRSFKKELSVNQPQELSGSLLDFADDLLDNSALVDASNNELLDTFISEHLGSTICSRCDRMTQTPVSILEIDPLGSAVPPSEELRQYSSKFEVLDKGSSQPATRLFLRGKPTGANLDEGLGICRVRGQKNSAFDVPSAVDLGRIKLPSTSGGNDALHIQRESLLYKAQKGKVQGLKVPETEVIEASMWMMPEDSKGKRKTKTRRQSEAPDMTAWKSNGRFMQCIYLLQPNENNLDLSKKSEAISDLSFKHLKAMPVTKHQTPERPSEKSGFKPSPRSSPPKTPSATRYISAAGSSPAVSSQLESWEDEDNAIVSVAQGIGQKLQSMVDYTKKLGPIKSKEGLISNAKSIAKDAEKLLQFATILGRYCLDKRVAQELQYAADLVPTVAAQLNILASVKAATTDDQTAHKMLIKTGKNLADAINKMLKCAEACCVKGLQQPPEDALDDVEAVILAAKWRHRLDRHRVHETLTAATDSLGLRRVSQERSAPALTQIKLKN